MGHLLKVAKDIHEGYIFKNTVSGLAIALRKQAAAKVEPVGQESSDTEVFMGLNEEEGAANYTYNESNMMTLTMAAPCAYIMNNDFPKLSKNNQFWCSYYKIMPPPNSQMIVMFFDRLFHFETQDDNQFCMQNR